MTTPAQIAEWRKAFESRLSFPQAERDGFHGQGYLFKDIEYAWQGYFRAKTEQATENEARRQFAHHDAPPVGVMLSALLRFAHVVRRNENAVSAAEPRLCAAHAPATEGHHSVAVCPSRQFNRE